MVWKANETGFPRSIFSSCIAVLLVVKELIVPTEVQNDLAGCPLSFWWLDEDRQPLHVNQLLNGNCVWFFIVWALTASYGELNVWRKINNRGGSSACSIEGNTQLAPSLHVRMSLRNIWSLYLHIWSKYGTLKSLVKLKMLYVTTSLSNIIFSFFMLDRNKLNWLYLDI